MGGGGKLIFSLRLRGKDGKKAPGGGLGIVRKNQGKVRQSKNRRGAKMEIVETGSAI